MMIKSALDYAREALGPDGPVDAITRSVKETEPTDNERFDAFIALLNEGDEEMACLVYAGVIPIPDHLTQP
jgi:hypothetical protein